MQVQKNMVVLLRYVMKNNNGEIIEDTINSKQIEYLHGCGNILPSLESVLEGLQAGTHKSFTLQDEKLNDPFHFDVIVDGVREATTEEIKWGRPVKKECGPDCCC